jgi:hypothetical protein
MMLWRCKIKHKNRRRRRLLFIMIGAICDNQQSIKQPVKWPYSCKDQRHCCYQELSLIDKHCLENFAKKINVKSLSNHAYRDKRLRQQMPQIDQVDQVLLNKVSTKVNQLNLLLNHEHHS